MIVYFTDRNLEIKAQASTNLPGGFRLYDDKLTESIESGVNIFDFKVSYNDKTREELESAIQVGSFVLRSGGRTDEHSNVYSSLYQIIETEFDTKDYSLYVYAEDAGLELLNKVCGEVTFTNRTLAQMLSATVPSDWSVNLIGTPTGTQTCTFDGENTATERVNSIVGLFDCEAYYSFEIERMSVTAKVLNVIPRRGNQNATVQLRLNKDIDRISTKKTIADIATALKVTGGTPEGSDVAVNLIGYSYHVTDGDEYASDYWYKQNVDSTIVDEGKIRNISACRRWASAIDPDGLIVKSFEYDDTNKATVAGQTKAQLKTDSQVGVEYTVDFVNLPEGTQIGDRVNIIDDDGGLYLEARLLTIETSVADRTQTATIGEYVLKSSGISQKVVDIADKLERERALREKCVVEADLRGYVNWDAENGLDMVSGSSVTSINLGDTLTWCKEYVQESQATNMSLYTNHFKQKYFSCYEEEEMEPGEDYFIVNSEGVLVPQNPNPPTPTQWANNKANYYTYEAIQYSSCVKTYNNEPVADSFNADETYYSYETLEIVEITQAEYEADPSKYCYKLYPYNDGYAMVVSSVDSSLYFHQCGTSTPYYSDRVYYIAGESNYTEVSITQAEYEADPTNYYYQSPSFSPAGTLTQSVIENLNPVRAETTEVTFFGGEGKIVTTAYYDASENETTILNIASAQHMDIEADGDIGMDADTLYVNANMKLDNVRVPHIYVSTSDPTSADGEDGDIWIKI